MARCRVDVCLIHYTTYRLTLANSSRPLLASTASADIVCRVLLFIFIWVPHSIVIDKATVAVAILTNSHSLFHFHLLSHMDGQFDGSTEHGISLHCSLQWTLNGLMRQARWNNRAKTIEIPRSIYYYYTIRFSLGFRVSDELRRPHIAQIAVHILLFFFAIFVHFILWIYLYV